MGKTKERGWMDITRLCYENLINVHTDNLPVVSVFLILRAFLVLG